MWPRMIGPVSYSPAPTMAPRPLKTMNKKIVISPIPQDRARILARIEKVVLKHHINVGGVSYDAWTKLVHQRIPELLAAEISVFESGVRQLRSEERRVGKECRSL